MTNNNQSNSNNISMPSNISNQESNNDYINAINSLSTESTSNMRIIQEGFSLDISNDNKDGN